MINSAVDQHAAARAESGADTAASGVSWSAIFAGAVAAAVLSFILVILGFGLGFSAVSPWSGEGSSAQTIGYSTIGWITFTQIAASAIGGYMAGRLRVKWSNLHNDEVFFRDTAHGFLAWAVASLVTAVLLSSAIGSVISGGSKLASSTGVAIATAGVAGGAAMTADAHNGPGMMEGMSGYFIDNLFRAPISRTGDHATASQSMPTEGRDNAVSPAQRMEVTRIFANAMRTGSLPDNDKAYISQLLATRTGMSQADAEKRVGDMYNSFKKVVDDAAAKAKDVAEHARKAAAYGALWMFVSMLCGAFIASFCATYGGRQRDREMTSSAKAGSTRPAVPAHS